jgi:hypothetical protein
MNCQAAPMLQNALMIVGRAGLERFLISLTLISYRHGARYELDHAPKAFIAENGAWLSNAIKQNQSSPANSSTNYYSESVWPTKSFAEINTLRPMHTRNIAASANLPASRLARASVRRHTRLS